MFLRRSHGRLPCVMWVCLLVLNALAWGDIADGDAPCEAWRDFGRLLLYQSGTGHYPSTGRCNQELDSVDADSREGVKAAEAILTEALAGYGQAATTLSGRIPLDIHPRCILGLHWAERFSGTRLGDWAGRQFDQCVEQACLAAMSASDDTWRARLDQELLTAGETGRGSLSAETFDAREVPYLYHYLIRNPASAEARNKARKCLADCLRQGYGLAPGLMQYLLLLDQGGEIDDTWLEVAAQLERIGAHARARRVYEEILTTTDSGERARQAFESLAHLLLLESRRREILTAWGIVSQRFPKVECTAAEVRDILSDSQSDRAAAQLLEALARTTDGPRGLQLCRSLDSLWSPEEALARWQKVIDGAEPGSVADQLGRVFLARARLAAGKAEESRAAIRGLAESSNPVVQAQSLTVLAEIAQAEGETEECFRLYAKAVQIDRPTALPTWCRDLFPRGALGAEMSGAGLQAQTLFLRGCNDLIDGSYAVAADSLSRAAEDPQRLPRPLRRVLPCMMMLAWLGAGDLAEAEAWGHQALGELGLDDRNSSMIAAVSSRIQDIDLAICRLLSRTRDQGSDAASEFAAIQDAIYVCNATMDLDAFTPPSAAVESGVQQMYARVKRLHTARVFEADYDYAVHRSTGSRTEDRTSRLDLLLFASQVLGEDASDRIQENLASVSKTDGSRDRMYRWAVFTQRVRRPDLAKGALDAAASEQSSAKDIEILQGIAEMYLAGSNHQKAIDVYKRVVANPKDPVAAQTVQLKIIDVYAENLKDYGKAIRECQGFIQRYPGSSKTSQVEFLMGRLSYLANDYAGAVGQLDGFRTRYPKHVQAGQAMVLAGLSRMAEGNTQEAVGRFREVIREYPDGELAARSKFLIGYAQVAEQQYSTALETLRQFIEQFPESQYVPQARALIDRLKKVSQ